MYINVFMVFNLLQCYTFWWNGTIASFWSLQLSLAQQKKKWRDQEKTSFISLKAWEMVIDNESFWFSS